MYTTSFEDCCGAWILSDFPGEEPGDLDKQDIKDVKSGLKLWLKNNSMKKGMTLVILNEYQDEGLGPVFIKNGFKFLHEAFNPNTGAKLYLYVYTHKKFKE